MTEYIKVMFARRNWFYPYKNQPFTLNNNTGQIYPITCVQG